jgi:arsenate reductase (thioredoxin)
MKAMRVPGFARFTALALTALVLTGAEPTRKRVLLLCTTNSCRSQISEAVLRSLDPRLDVYSAGTEPAAQVNPYAVRVMREIGIDIAGAKPKAADPFLTQSFDYLITVCDETDQNCPVFRGKIGTRAHLGFPDPAKVAGTEQKLAAFRQVRDDIRTRFTEYYEKNIKKSLGGR